MTEYAKKSPGEKKITMLKGNPVKISGTGKYIPEKIMTNFDFEKIIETSDEWIVERTGIKKRHFASEEQRCRDLAAKAGAAALEDAKLSPEDIDLVIVATNSPDDLCPSVAAHVHGMLGTTKAGAYDVIAGCTGSLTAMLTAIGGISSGLWNHVLVIGAEDFAHLIDWTDRSTCILFGDGAGACVLSRAEEGEGHFLAGKITADGSKADYIDFQPDPVHGGLKVCMKGSAVFKYVIATLPAFIRDFCEEAGVAPAEVDFWLLHQANTRIIDGLFKRLGVPTDRTLTNLENYGNTSSASLMITLDEAMKAGRLRRGEKTLFTAFGAGMTIGALLYEA